MEYECHHITAPTFELSARRCKARYFLGLSATVTRKDGQHPIIFMQLGPLRYRVTDKEQADRRPFDHEAVVRLTDFSLPDNNDAEITIQQIYSLLCSDKKRNDLIVKDVCHVLNNGRSPIILTERREHVELLSKLLSEHVEKVFVLQGGLGKKKMREVLQNLAARSDYERVALIATGRFIGEGFDDARLDTLFLSLPVSWKGTLAQYAGRLHRLHQAKQKVIIYDYTDLNVPVLAKMFERRKKGYKTIGYKVTDDRRFSDTKIQDPLDSD